MIPTDIIETKRVKAEGNVFLFPVDLFNLYWVNVHA